VQRADAERTIVASGLQPGEQIVTRGQLRLAPKTRVQIGKPGAEAS
jgi:multidrug efflux pump subunit AcrA (membrane-fusion protein)